MTTFWERPQQLTVCWRSQELLSSLVSGCQVVLVVSIARCWGSRLVLTEPRLELALRWAVCCCPAHWQLNRFKEVLGAKTSRTRPSKTKTIILPGGEAKPGLHCTSGITSLYRKFCLVNLHVVDIIFFFFFFLRCQHVRSLVALCFVSSSQDLLTVLAGPPDPIQDTTYRCDTAVTVLSWKDIVVQAPEDSSWYAESMKTAGTVNN